MVCRSRRGSSSRTTDGQSAAVLELTQYDIDGARRGEFATFVRRGYVFVQVDVRGRGRRGEKTEDSARRSDATVTMSSSGLPRSRGVMGTSLCTAGRTWA